MSWRQRIVHWILSPAGLALASSGLMFAYDEWRSAENEAEKELIRAKQGAEAPAPAPLPPLFQAIREKNADGVRAAIAQGADPNAADGGTLPLHFALIKNGGWPGDRGVIAALLQGGADVNAPMKSGHTALHAAVGRSRKDLIELLLERGAAIDAQTKDGRTPLQLASSVEIAELLLARGADAAGLADPDDTRFIEAIRSGDRQFAGFLLARGADPNRPSRQGVPPILAASGTGKAEMVALLLAAGARPDIKYRDGSSMLHEVARANNLAVGKLLIEAGADVNAARASGWTPLHVASSLCHEEFAEMLIAAGANPGARDKRGKAPLPCYAFARRPDRSEPMRIASCR